MEKVAVILKPDCLRRNLEKFLIESIISSGLIVENVRIIELNDFLLGIIYEDIIQEHFFGDLVKFMKSGPCMVLLVSGVDAVCSMNQLKHALRRECRESWMNLSDEDIKLWESNRHPNQVALNNKLVAENLIHVFDSEDKSIRFTKIIFSQ